MTDWTTYLRRLVLALAAVSLLLPLAPDAGARAFSLLVHQDAGRLAAYDAEAYDYLRLTHAVLGSVMAGWFATMYVLLRGAGVTPTTWTALVVGLAVWALPDTAYSLLSGFPENAALNVACLLLITPGLVGTRPRRERQGAPAG